MKKIPPKTNPSALTDTARAADGTSDSNQQKELCLREKEFDLKKLDIESQILMRKSKDKDWWDKLGSVKGSVLEN